MRLIFSGVLCVQVRKLHLEPLRFCQAAELEQLQEFLKSETERVQHEIDAVLDGIGIIIEALAPWKTAELASAQNTPANGRDKLKHWP